MPLFLQIMTGLKDNADSFRPTNVWLPFPIEIVKIVLTPAVNAIKLFTPSNQETLTEREGSVELTSLY